MMVPSYSYPSGGKLVPILAQRTDDSRAVPYLPCLQKEVLLPFRFENKIPQTFTGSQQNTIGSYQYQPPRQTGKLGQVVVTATFAVDELRILWTPSRNILGPYF